MKKQKVQLFFCAFCLLASIVMLVHTSIAYFSISEETSSTITTRNVSISLTEAAVETDSHGNVVRASNGARSYKKNGLLVHDYGVIHAGQIISKDPTITNTSSHPVWIAAKVTLTDGAGDLTRIMGYEGYQDIDLEILLSGGLLDEPTHFGTWNGIPDVTYNDRYAMIQIPNMLEGRFEFIFLMLEPVEVGDSVTLFDQINIPEEWSTEQMQHLKEFGMLIQAYGVQTAGLDTCQQAMTDAFPNHFESIDSTIK